MFITYKLKYVGKCYVTANKHIKVDGCTIKNKLYRLEDFIKKYKNYCFTNVWSLGVPLRLNVIKVKEQLQPEYIYSLYKQTNSFECILLTFDANILEWLEFKDNEE